MIQEITNENAAFLLKKLFDKGLLPWKVFLYRDIYLQYDIYIKKGNKPSEARYLTADDFKVDKTTVLRAVNKMKP